MSSNLIPVSSVLRKGWIAVRFIFFGVGGLLFVLYGSIGFLSWVTEQLPDVGEFFSPIQSIAFTLLGTFMILYGVGEWKHWRYLWVVPSVPVIFLGFLAFAVSLPQRWQERIDSDFLDRLLGPKLSFLPFLLLAAVPALFGGTFARRHYRRRNNAMTVK